MDAIILADAKAHLSELVDRVEAGESIDIPRHRVDGRYGRVAIIPTRWFRGVCS
ncbi:type II toxin-antitoxin system prevent-host-death family antitoxin [Acidiphilium acidophilum]|uniref:type II toxin-antitoxin system Phd/YefM family antitoxin n=1 Tax=Acidiphilium acidophilum TaxID=76588 RepID=UPI002E8E6184|nr:type II toxin-antitoxin system prevent-host-death family antitoxin [Acidiphilium acidophilum]